MARQLISILEIADVICEDVGDVTKRFRSSILRHLGRCYTNLKVFVSDETDIATVITPVSNIIEMPSDFIYETKVGIKQGDRVLFLNKNYDNTGSSILSVNQSQAEKYIETYFKMSDVREYECIETPFYNYKGELLLRGYGSGIQCDGMYTVDRKNGRIAIGSIIPRGCEVVVEYVSDGTGRGVKMVPIEFYDCLYHYGLWKFFFQRGDGRYRQSERDYDTAYYQLDMLYRAVPISYVVKLMNQEMHTIDGRL